MNFAVVSLHNEHYNELAKITWTNKEEYAEKHGYAYACKTDNFYNVNIGFEKIWFLRDMLNEYPNIDWFWWTGCDTLITNMTIKIEDRIDNNYHFIIAHDCHNLNADSFFIRNSPEGKAYLEMIISKYDQYKDHGWAEQQVMIDTLDEYKHMIKILPQKSINSYNYDLYPEKTNKHLDMGGEDGHWSYGDLLIHWPGTTLPHRIHLAQFYVQHVVR